MILSQREKEKQFTDLVSEAKKIAVIADESANVDTLAASLALGHLLRGLGKKVVNVFAGPIPEGIRSLPGVDKIQKDLGPKNLVVSINYKDDPIEKISYSVEDDNLNLVIHPTGRGFDVKKIRYFYEESGIDLIITLATSSLKSLGLIYETARKEFEKSPIVNIDISSENTRFGQINIVEPESHSVSQLLFGKMAEWKYVPNKEAAQCLLAGMSEGEGGLEVTAV